MMRKIRWYLLLCCMSQFSLAHSMQPDCTKDFQVWGKSCFTSKGVISVQKKYLKNLPVNSAGVAIIYHRDKQKFLAINKSGAVIFEDIFPFDNGPDNFNNGLARFKSKNKCGYFNVKYQIAISAQFDGCMPFNDGVAQVCYQCKSICANDTCEHRVFDGGTWYSIDKNGKKIETDHTLKNINECRNPRVSKTSNLEVECD